MTAAKRKSTIESTAPNAILDHMRRRIGRIGLLVGLLSTVLAAAAIFLICACASTR